MLVVCMLKFEMDPLYDWVVSFDDLRNSAPFLDVRLDETDGV